MNVLVIPEDFRKDRFILKPIIDAMMKSLGTKAMVRVCMDPLLGGLHQALKWENIQLIIKRYLWFVDLFLLCVDRDGDANRRAALDNREKRSRPLLKGKLLFAENAWQELEVWVLAGHDLPAGWDWGAIRLEIDAKEKYYRPFARQRRVIEGPGEGRQALAEEAARRYDRIRQLCPEDVAALEGRIRQQAAQT